MSRPFRDLLLHNCVCLRVCMAHITQKCNSSLNLDLYVSARSPAIGFDIDSSASDFTNIVLLILSSFLLLSLLYLRLESKYTDDVCQLKRKLCKLLKNKTVKTSTPGRCVVCVPAVRETLSHRGHVCVVSFTVMVVSRECALKLESQNRHL